MRGAASGYGLPKQWVSDVRAMYAKQYGAIVVHGNHRVLREPELNV